MISYDNYKNRIQKVAKAKRILHKFRFVICGALALIVGTSVGLMVAKGSYTSGMSLSAQSVMFNEDYEVGAAKAFLCSPSEQYVEYRAENGDWTKKKPVKAGKYSARTVTRKLVGYNYSSAVDFEILPIEADFTITGTSVTYGSAPAFTVPQLVSGHGVDKSALQFEYAAYGAPSTEVNVVESSIKIVDESGDDFTGCYTITPHGSTLTVNKKNITVRPENYEFTYDAQPHFAENAVSVETLAELVKGDTLTVTTAVNDYVGGAVNAGAYTVGCNGITIMHGDTDISGWYDISSLTSELKVARRKFTLTTGDAEKVYDGTPAENAHPSCENLVEGHSASVDAATLCKIANVGTYDNVYEVTIFDGTTDVTDNYEIDKNTSKYGKLTVKPRPIVIELNAIADVTYGETFAYKDEAGNYANLPDLASGEKLKIAVTYRQEGEVVAPKDAGGYSAVLDLENCAFYDIDGNEIEGGVNNYSVECAPLDGLKINKFEFIIKPLDLTKENGAEITYGDEVKYPDYLGNYFGLSSKEAGAYDIERLPYGEQIKIIGLIRITDETGNDVADKLNVGTYRITAGYIAVFDSDGNAIQSNSNYRFAASEYAELEVVSREITVTVDDKTATYGEALPENSFTVTKGALQYDEELTFTAHYEQGGETCAPETWEDYTLLNAGAYYIVYNNDEAIVGGNASTGNYAFTFVAGKLEITARVIIVTTATDEKIYDGKPLENDGYTTVWAEDGERKGLLNGDELIKDTNNTVINPPVAGPYFNVCNYKVPNNNYYIDNSATVLGTLTIKPRPIIVYTGSASKPYDGTPLTCAEYTDVKFAVSDEATGKWIADDGQAGLIEGDGLRLASKLVEITNVGEKENANEYANGNYNIVGYVNGTLSVTKEHLEISMRHQSASAVYGNYPDGFTVLSDIPTDGLSYLITADGKELKLPDGQWLAVYFDIVGTDGAPDVGNYTLKAYYYKIYSIEGTLLDEGDGDSLENYTITCADGELEIFEYSIEGKVVDQTAVYGSELPDNECDIEHGAFETKYPLGENIEFEFAYDRDVKDVGEYEITVTGIKVYDKDGNLKEDGAKNYDFSKIQIGTLTVTQAELTVKFRYNLVTQPERIYYGTDWSYPTGAGNYKKNNDSVSGLANGEEIEIVVSIFSATLNGVVEKPVNTGVYSITVDRQNSRIYSSDGSEIIGGIENYKIKSVMQGNLRITPKPVTVTFVGNSVDYGDDLTDFIHEYTTDLDGNMPYNESFEICGFIYLTDGEEAPERKNAGEYDIEGKDLVFYDEDGNEIANGENNYVITYEGTLTIKQKEIDIELVDQTYVYGDAYAHFTGGWASENFYVFKDSGKFDYLEYGEVLSVKFKFSQSGEEVTPRNVGDYVMSAVEFRVSDGVDGELKTADNYIINCDEGKLTITARPITVYVQDYELTYGETLVFRNGMFRDIEGVEHSESGRYKMPYGDNLAVVFLLDDNPLKVNQIFDAGTHTISVQQWFVQNSSVEGRYVPNENYDVTWVDGTLTVLPRTIYVCIDENNKTTYGTAPENIGYKIYIDDKIYIEDKGEVVEYELPASDAITADFEYYAFGDPDRTIITVKNAGEYGVTVAKVYINDKETSIGAENYVTGNYVIEVIDGKLTVNKKSVTVELNQIDPVYYGETFTYAAGVDNYVNSDTIELAYNERLEVVVKYLIDGKDGEPKNVNYEEPRNGREESYRFAYSACLNDGACVVYEADGVTVVANGAGNYDFVCDDLVDLKIMRRTIYIYLDDLDDVEYGDEVKYPEGVHNFKRVEYKDGETVVEGAPYDEQFEVEVEYLDNNGKVVDKPVDVGTYKIRLGGITVYDENGNRLTYGASNYAFATAAPYQGTVNVIPRKITIYLWDFEIEYGEFDDFDYPSGEGNYDTDNSDELVYNQTLEVAFSEKFIYKQLIDGEYKEVTPKDVGEYQITFEKDDYAIFDADETYYDGSYDITFVPGTLTIKRREIIIVVDDKTCTYGDALPENSYKICDSYYKEYELPYGDEFAVTEYEYYVDDDGAVVFVTPRNAGEYTVTVKSETITNGGKDVSSNYLFGQCAGGTLTIEKATLYIGIKNVNNVVYGKTVQVTDENVTVSGLRYEETLNVAVYYVREGDTEPTTPKNAGTYKVYLDGENTAVNAEDEAARVLACNYTWYYAVGKVTILPRAVKVTFDEQNRIYGEEIEDDTFTLTVNVDDITDGSITSTALPYGEELEIVTWYFDGVDHLESPRNTGTYRIDAKTVTVVGDDGVAAENYTFTYDEVNLKISPKTINIKLDDISSVYGDYEYTQPDTNTFSPNTDEDKLEYDDQLVINIRFTLVGDESSATDIERYNVGEYSIVATRFTVTYFDERVEISANGKLSNYEIVCDNGTLEVTPKQLHVAISTEVEITYGKNAPAYKDIPYTVTSGGEIIEELPYGDTLGVGRYYVVDGVGTPVNAGTYVIKYDGADVNLGEFNDNYEISGEDGLLTIRQKEIEVTIKGGKAVYGYEGMPEIEHEVTVGEMVGEEKLVPAYLFSLNGTPCKPVNVGVYDITVDEENCSVESGNKLYENYKVNYVYDGKFEITRAPLTVKIIGDNFTYGERDINVTFEITEGELFHDDVLELKYRFTNEVNGEKSSAPTASGTYAITATAAIVGGNASVDNYDIEYVDNEPTLTISKRGIKIVLNSSGVTSFTYGTPYGGEIRKAEITDAVSGEQITDEQITVAVIYSKKEESVARARMLRARTYSLREAEAFIPKDAGTYIAMLDFGNCTVTDADGKPVDGGIGNYELAVDCASVEFVITPMTLTVTVIDAEITYGDKLPAILDYGVEELMPNGESLNLTFSFADENDNLPVHVKEGGYPVSVASATVNGGSIGNYELNYTNEQPTLTIKAKPVKLRLSNISRPYGVKVEYEEKVNNYNTGASESLCDGDELTVTKVKYEGEDGTEYSVENPPENVGNYDIIFVDCTIVNADGESAKGDYQIEWTNGVLIIDSSIITVYTASAEKEYDGTALSTDKYARVEGNLGDYKLVAVKDTIREQIDVTDGEGVDNTTEFKIVDAAGNETGNLKLEYGTPGKLKVIPKKAEVTITDVTAVYGEYPEIKHTAGLVDGEDVEFEVNYSVTPVTDDTHFILPVGNYLMNYKTGSATVVGGRGKASNYEFEFKPDAALEVTPRHIIVTTADDKREYDGTAFSKADGYTTAWVAGGEGLLNDDVLTVDYTAAITEYGTRKNDCTYIVSDNYVIDSYVHGTLSVTQRKLAAKTADVNEVYDGKVHSSGVISDVNGKRVAGHEFRVTSELVERVDVCTRVTNKFEFIIVDTNNGDKDVTENYDITPTYGRITITPRPLEVTTGGVSGVTYDGLPHGNGNYEKADGLLTELGHGLVVDGDPFTYINATAGVDNTTEYKVYCDGKDISGNYQITYKRGKIVIGKKPVTVTLNGGVEVEYGDNSYVELLTDNAVTLVNGETVKLAITVAGGVSGKGTYTANVDWANGVVRSAEGKVIANGANNYQVSAGAVTFEVIPRKIEVTLNAGGKTQFVYGEDFEKAILTVSVDRMVGSEKFNAAVTYDKPNPKNVDDYTATLYLDGCSVDGGDLGNYDVVLCEEVAFAITAKELTVDMDDITARYGETPAYAEGEGGYKHVEGLVYGDTLKAVTPAFERNGASVADLFAGKYDIVCDGVEVVNGTEIVTGNYTFKTGTKGTLSIVGVGLEIERKTVKKTYDGTPLALDPAAPETEVSYVINNDESLKLPAGYTIVLDGTFATADGNVSSSCANTAKYKVLNADGEVAGEYEVGYKGNGARLEIEQRTIKVTTATPEEHVYDGTPLTAADCAITEGMLVSGHGLTTSHPAQLIDADSIPNAMTVTVKAGDEDVTANYDIKVTYGTLTVTPMPVSVTIDSISAVYGEDTGVDGIRQQALVGNQKLVYRLLVNGLPADKTLLNVDTYGITANTSTMSVNGGNIVNYEITFNTDATLTITKRYIIVTTATDEKIYDGTAFSKTDGYATAWVEGGEGLLNDDVLTVDYTATLTEKGSCDNDCTYTVSDNYFIADYVYGTLTVKPREITVTTNGISGEYRGTAYSDGGFTNDSKLLDIHNISISGDAPEFLDATDDAKNVFEVVITEKAGGRNVTANYDINYAYGDVVITKRNLIVTLNDSQTSFYYGDDTFDGKFKDVTVAEGEDNGLVGGDKLTAVALVYGTQSGEAPVNAGKYTVRLDLENSFIKYAGAGNGIGNYDIECAQVSFEIKRNGVTFTLDTCASETYDGEEHKYAVGGCHLTTELNNGESLLNVVVKYSLDFDGKSVIDGAPVNAGKYYISIDTANTKVNGAQGVEAIETNYAVTCEPVEFVIAPRKLAVTLSNVEHVYDGEAYDFAGGNGFASDICEKDENKIVINVTYDGEPIDAGTYTVTFDKQLEFTDVVTAGNYVLDEENSKLTCTLTIKQRKITVTVADHDVEKGSVEEYTKSDLSGGFVTGDLDKAEVSFVYTDGDGNESYIVPAAVGTYKVSAALGGKVMDNYGFTVKEGKLIITERKVLVTPVFKGESNTYNGSAFVFGYEDVHNVAVAAGEKGFLENDKNVAKFVETYSYVDQNGVSHDGTPTDAGTYEISVTLSGEGTEQYCISYGKLPFTIAKRDLTYKVEVEGAGEYEYSNSRPAFSATLKEYSGFINDNELPEYTCELFVGDKPVERYNVGTYDVKIKFEGMENYRVFATTAQISITPRTIVVIPTDPYEGKEQLYAGENLKLGELNRTVLGIGENGGLAEGDELTVESNELKPSSISGSLKISAVYITDGENDISKNYNVIMSYNRADKTITALNLESRHFVVNVRYKVREIEYELDGVGKEIAYSGKTYIYNFGGMEKIIVGEDMRQVLDGLGLEIRVPDSVTVPAAADDYTNLISDLVYVYDGKGNRLSAVVAVCTNGDDEENVIRVVKNVVSLDLDGLTEENIESVSERQVTFDEKAFVCNAEAHAYLLDGEWLIGITLFNDSGIDLSANYELNVNRTLDFAEVKIITLAQAAEYLRSEIKVVIEIGEEGLAGKYTYDGESRWVLSESGNYEVTGDLQSGHTLQVLVFVENGEYVLGVSIYSTENGQRKEAGSNYRVIVKSDVAARYVTIAETSTMERELKIDFSGAFDGDGRPKTDENGLLIGYDVNGLNRTEGHEIEVTVTETEDGYVVKVAVYQLRRQGASYKKNNVAAKYEWETVAPAGVTVEVMTGTLN